jgi:uncharacterized membrane protein
MPENATPVAAGKIRLAQVLLVGALAISLYLLYSTIKGGGIAGCGPESGCSEVLNSRWSKVASIPVSALAAGVYILTLFAATRLAAGSQTAQRWVTAAACTILAAALWFVALQLFLLHAICIFCMSAHLLGALASMLLLSSVLQSPAKADLMPSFSGGISALLLMILLQVAIQPKTAVFHKYATASVANTSNAPVAPAAAPAVTNLPSTPLAATSAPVAPKLQSLAKLQSLSLPPPQSVLSILGGEFKLDLTELPAIGPRNAQHKVVALFDYTCKHCRHTHALLHEAMHEITNFGLVSLPVPLDSNCNRLVRRTPAPHANACEYARTALAVWRCAPDLFPKYDAWVFQGELPPSLDQMRQYAAELVGAEKLAAALNDPWITERIQKDVDIYASNSKAAKNGALPQLIFPTGVLVGGLRDLNNTYENLRQFLGVTNTVPQVQKGG